MLCTTMFCVAENALVTGNFAQKKKRIQTDRFKVLLYLKKSGLDKSGQAPIMGRITYGRTIAQFSCKLSCDPKLWNARESRLNGKLERLLLSVQSAFRLLCERGAVFTATDIKRDIIPTCAIRDACYMQFFLS